MDKLSIIVPCYNEEESTLSFYEAAQKVITKMDIEPEHWFVSDGSHDNSPAKMRVLHKKDEKHAYYIFFSRNLGKEAGLLAGLNAATDDYVVVMDVDLQDPPEFLPEMHKELQSGEHDCTGTRRVDRISEAKIKSFLSDVLYKCVNKISDTEIAPDTRDLRMMTRQMVDAVFSMGEYSRSSKGIFFWVGFKTKYLGYHNAERVAGENDWSTWQLFKYAMDGISDFPQAPLSSAVWTGSVIPAISVISITFVITRKIMSPTSSIFGWASMVSIILFLGGVQLLCIGIVGKYIGRIYLQVKHRPIYTVKEKKQPKDFLL